MDMNTSQCRCGVKAQQGIIQHVAWVSISGWDVQHGDEKMPEWS